MIKRRIVLFIFLLSCLFGAFIPAKMKINLVYANDSYVAMIGQTGYEDLKTAIEQAVDGEKITIVKSHTIEVVSNATSFLSVAGKSVEIDLNGKEILVNVSCTMTVLFMTNESGGSAGHLTIVDSSSEKTGLIDVVVSSTGVLSNLVRNSNNCSITIESGNFKMNKSENGAGMIDSRCNTETESKIGVYINGGNFFLENVGTLSNGSPWIINTSGQNEKGVIVKGGTFNSNINNQFYPFEVDMSENLALKDNDDGTWTVVPSICYVVVRHKSGLWYSRTEGYASFEEAFSVIDESKVEVENGYGSVLTITKDCYTTRDSFVVPSDRNITIDLYAKIFLEDGYEIPANATVNLCSTESLVAIYVPEIDEPPIEEPVEEPIENDENEGLNNEKTENYETPNNSNVGMIVGITSGGVAVVGGGVAVYFFVIKKKLAKSAAKIITKKSSIKKEINNKTKNKKGS